MFRSDVEALVRKVDSPANEICLRIIEDNRELFRTAPGSTHNHQAWLGGYWDHLTEVMNLWVLLYGALASGTGRLQLFEDDEPVELFPESERFTLSDGLLVLFLHDIEKPWRCRLENGELVVIPELKSKAARKEFRDRKLAEYGLVLTPQQQNALHYAEGVRDDEYTPDARIMSPLATLVHCCDLISARLFYDFPRPLGKDTWLGAARVSTLEP